MKKIIICSLLFFVVSWSKEQILLLPTYHFEISDDYARRVNIAFKKQLDTAYYFLKEILLFLGKDNTCSSLDCAEEFSDQMNLSNVIYTEILKDELDWYYIVNLVDFDKEKIYRDSIYSNYGVYNIPTFFTPLAERVAIISHKWEKEAAELKEKLMQDSLQQLDSFPSDSTFLIDSTVVDALVEEIKN